MTDRAYSTLVKKLMPSAPGCPTPTAIEYIRDSAIRTCERTLAYRYSPATTTLVSGTSEYSFTTPANAEVCAVLSATLNDVPLSIATLEETTGLVPEWTGSSGQPQYLTQITPDKFVLMPEPDSAATYTVRMIVALKPTLDSTGMEQVAFNHMEETILHGALQHLLVLPNKEWSDRELAAYHAKQYIYRVATLRARANLGAMRASLRVQPTPFV